MAVRRYSRYETDPTDPDTLVYQGDDAERNTALALPDNPYVPPAYAAPGASSGLTLGSLVPTRKTSESDLDAFNRSLRTSDLWQGYMTKLGRPADRTLKLSERERDDFSNYLRANGIDIPKGMKVDQAGNFNQKNTLWKNIGKGALIGGAAAGAIFGIPAIAGAIGGGGAAAGGAAAGAGAASAAGAGAAAGTAAAATGAGMAAGGGLLGTALPHIITGVAGLGTTMLASRAQNKSAERAAATAAASEGRMLDYYRSKDAEDRNSLSEQNRLAREQWEAEQQFQRDKWNAEQADRELERQWAIEDREWQKAERERREAERGSGAALAEQQRKEREAKYAPYNALRAQALASLGSILNLGGAPQAVAGGGSLGQILNLGGGVARPVGSPMNAPYMPATGSFTLGDLLQLRGQHG